MRTLSAHCLLHREIVRSLPHGERAEDLLGHRVDPHDAGRRMRPAIFGQTDVTATPLGPGCAFLGVQFFACNRMRATIFGLSAATSFDSPMSFFRL